MSTNRQMPRMLPTGVLLGHRQNVRDNVGDVTELAASIRQHGLIQPIVVTPHPIHGGMYLILAGHRRAAAAQSIPLQQVPCIIRPDAGDVDDHLALMLVENIQRRNLSPVEKARAMKKLIDRGATQADLARRLGVTAAAVERLTKRARAALNAGPTPEQVVGLYGQVQSALDYLAESGDTTQLAPRQVETAPTVGGVL